MSGTINRFSPRDVPEDVWQRVEPVVKQTVTAGAPDTPFHADHQLSIVTQLAVWADRIGQPVDPEHLFSPEFIDRFIVEGCAHLSHGSRLNYRTHLWKIGAAVLGHQLFPPRALPLKRSDVSPPTYRPRWPSSGAGRAGSPRPICDATPGHCWPSDSGPG